MAFEILAILVTGAAVALAWYLFRKPAAPKPPVKPPVQPKQEEQKDSLLPMKIFYGSQSGTAETFAEELAQEAKLFGFSAQAVDLEHYDPEDLGQEKCCVFLMATFGEGEPTDNAVSFYEWIMKTESRTPDYFKDVPFAVFALGNRQYEHFCNVGRNVDANLHKFGGIRLCAHGEGDDDANLAEDYAEWKATFWTAVRNHFGLKGHVNLDDMAFTPACTFKVLGDLTDPGCTVKYDTCQALTRDPKTTTYWVDVVSVRELRQDTKDGGSTIHMDISIEGAPRLKYNTADNLGIHPRNDPEKARKLIERLGANPNMLFSLKKPNDAKFMLPTPCSMQDAFLWYVDFNNTPRSKTLKLLSNYAQDPAEKTQLSNFASIEKDKFAEDQMSLYEVMMEFRSIQIPIEHFLELCPKISHRLYTISSSSKANPRRISVTSSLILEKKPRDREFRGLCTSYLLTLRPSDKICVSVRPSSFRLPHISKLPTTPVIMIGPGTGVAPFKGFIEEFIHLQGQGMDVDCHLFFGCKKSNQDFIYKEEFEAAHKSGVLKGMTVAFSREQETKVYVQHRLQEEAARVWKLIDEKKASVFVCGATAMGRNVKEALLWVVKQEGGKTEAEAKKYVDGLVTKGRYVQELWS